MPSAVQRPILPFVPDRYEPRGRLGDYARANGRDVADAIRANGQASAQLWSGIGQNVSGTLRDIAAYPEQQRQAAMQQQQAAMLAQKQQRDEQAYQEQQQAKEAEKQKVAAVQSLIQKYNGEPPDDELIAVAGYEDAGHIKSALMSLKPKVELPKTREIKTRNADGSETVNVIEDKPGQTFTSAAPPKELPKVGTFEDYVVRKFGANPTPEQIESGRKSFLQADDRPLIQDGSRDDAKAIAQAIRDGLQPPEVTGLYRLAGPVRAELSKQGYDLSKANLDWNATKRHLTTLNGAQQTRLRQAIVTAADSLDVIDSLANQWKGGRFPILNKANLALAKNGAYGQEAASIATQLEGQITDVTSELANAYMGGNSPTDHALSLAAKNLSANWDQKVLSDMVKLARTNLQIRRNSIEQAGPITATTQQQQTAPKIDEEWIIDAKGNLVKKGKG